MHAKVITVGESTGGLLPEFGYGCLASSTGDERCQVQAVWELSHASKAYERCSTGPHSVLSQATPAEEMQSSCQGGPLFAA